MTGRDTDNRPFLGRGWAFPLSLAGGDVALSAAERDIREAITIILETAPGERAMRPDFGVGIRRMVFHPISRGNISVMQERIREALLIWEPRIDVQTVTVRTDPDQPGWLYIDIQYRVRESNTLANFVYPFYLQEAS